MAGTHSHSPANIWAAVSSSHSRSAGQSNHTAIMPQPMSLPTAAGQINDLVANATASDLSKLSQASCLLSFETAFLGLIWPHSGKVCRQMSSRRSQRFSAKVRVSEIRRAGQIRSLLGMSHAQVCRRFDDVFQAGIQEALSGRRGNLHFDERRAPTVY